MAAPRLPPQHEQRDLPVLGLGLCRCEITVPLTQDNRLAGARGHRRRLQITQRQNHNAEKKNGFFSHLLVSLLNPEILLVFSPIVKQKKGNGKLSFPAPFSFQTPIKS
jgi:hypothetical protein